MADEENSVYINVRIKREEADRWRRRIMHGLREDVARSALMAALSFVEKHGAIGAALLIDGNVKITVADPSRLDQDSGVRLTDTTKEEE